MICYTNNLISRYTGKYLHPWLVQELQNRKLRFSQTQIIWDAQKTRI
nr:MAG TPA: hypothetical protein [Caudoviricetes sp.]